MRSPLLITVATIAAVIALGLCLQAIGVPVDWSF
jgi:hypothetical protein